MEYGPAKYVQYSTARSSYRTSVLVGFGVCTMSVDGFAQSGITGSTEANWGVFGGACGDSEPLSLFNNCNMACPMNAPHRNGGRWVHEASAIDPREK